MPLDSTIDRVTDRIRARSEATRTAYLARITRAHAAGPARAHLSCSNQAHAYAAMAGDKAALAAARAPHLGIVTAYNDMLSAHRPYEDYPEAIRAAARAAGATAQVAGGVPAMCDGVTQGQPGMELSLFSRDVIALAAGVAMSHNCFDAALWLGVCDKIVPGLVMAAATFGHVPAVFVPAGPMTSGLPNDEKARVREAFATGAVGREALMAAEMASYHGPGTCTFYGTANTNQMLMEFMGLHLPGAAFVNPGTPLRAALTEAAVARAAAITALGNDWRPVGHILDERAFVNGIVGLMATGGSTNLVLHLPAMARAAGLILDPGDFAAIARAVPLMARVYPNGLADVNHFHAAGGTAFLVGQLLEAGLLHEDALTVAEGGLAAYATEPRLAADAAGSAVVHPAAHGSFPLPSGSLSSSGISADTPAADTPGAAGSDPAVTSGNGATASDAPIPADAPTAVPGTLAAPADTPAPAPGALPPDADIAPPALLAARLVWVPGPRESLNDRILRPVSDPFQPTGGLVSLDGNLGRAVLKTSAIPADRHAIEAPARIFHHQLEVREAFRRGEFTADTVIVLRFQGPRANGMPELHALTPVLSVLQERGLRVALVTDGRMSGASGKVPAAIHLSPEAAEGGPLARLRDGDLIRLDAGTGVLEAKVPDLHDRPPVMPDLSANAEGIGRELFAAFRAHVGPATTGASVIL
ncbi:MAG: dihydroxy-acid dehydratase [Gemmobacter sp.]